MEHEPGDEYIRRIASYIRTHEQGLAAAGLTRRRRTKAPPDSSVFNPLGWFTSDNAIPANTKPVVLSFDSHHLFYLLMRMEALGLDVGSLDVQVDNPSRPMNYVNIFFGSDKSDALSLMSFRSSLSAVSRLSLGSGWWGRPPPPSVDAELKYVFSAFTKLPAISLHAPESRLIAELANEAPNENALPLDAFKNLQTLQCVDIDPRTMLGWDRLAESLRSLTVKKSGLEDVSDIFIGAVLDDQARREGKLGSGGSRKISRGPSRQTSFYSTRLPESVPEDAEDAEDSPDTTSIEETPRRDSLPSLKWAFLRHLSLSDNALTFLPTSPLPYLTSLTHLDLSSNLLVSVPPGLSSLYNLISLNLSDNMIDSVLGIYTMLGQVLHLNLSHNRLESICGLERLLALERVDLRRNLVEESAEIGRLATLPNIAEVWIEGNPLSEFEEGYRIRCFDYFSKEGKSILLDGSPPGLYEKMYLTSPPPQQMTSSRPPTAYSPPVVAVGHSPRPAASISHDSPVESASPSLPPSQTASPQTAAVKGRGRRRKNKRIVDLDSGVEASESARSRSDSHVPVSRVGSPVKPAVEESKATPADASPAPISSPSAIIPVVRPPPKSRHSRHFTEFAPASKGLSDDMSPALSAVARPASLRKNSTLTSKQAMRRARLSASVYEPQGEPDGGQFREADAFRARIEALRSDMGDGWLKVFNQSQLGSPPGVPSG
ncbi:L domain-like protein [Amylocystis lapponica]|nr:L domain-like protein [Amylocystis lapponica]